MKKDVKGLENKSQRGISLITLVVTIVVMIILALITMEGSGIQIEEASTAEYKYELKEIEVTVSAQRTSNQLGGIGEEFKEKGFTPVIIKNPPKEYTSFDGWDLYGYDSGICYGYVIDLEKIDEDGAKRGNEYSKYQTFDANKTIIFGKNGKDNDVYIYDALGKVYYAKGFYIEGGVYFSDIFYDEDPVDIENNYEEIETAIYRVTYHYNNGTTENQTVEKNENKTIRLIPPIKPEREGFVLKGWSKNSAATNVDYEVGALFAEDRNIDLYAVWQKGESKKYEITFNANGGTNAPSKIEKKEGETVTLPTEIPTRSGYVFDGWSKNSKAVEGEYQAGTAYAEDDSVVLFAIWSTENAKVEIEVTPSDNAGNVVGAGNKKAGNIVYITATAKNGYAFKKWSVKAGSVPVNLDNIYSEKTKFVMPNGTVLLKAEFEEKEYDYVIKYNANNGTGAPNTQYKKHDAGIQISNQIPTREGYIFKGWTDTLSSKTVKYNPLDNYSENKNTTLYAIWLKEEKRYTIAFDANGGQISGEGSARTTRYIKDGQKLEEMELGIPKAQREGHYFVGWFTEKIDGTKISETTIASEAIEGLKLYAQWKAEIYTLTAEKTINGNITPIVAYVNYGEMQTFEIIPNEGYEINDVKVDGISVKSNLIALEGGDAKEYTFENVKKNQKISAEFKEKTYTITFDPTGGKVSPTSKKVTYNGIYKELPVPTKDGYNFLGWFTKESDGTKIIENSQLIVNADHTIYANWEVNNRAPDLAEITASSKTTNSITFDIWGMDPDGDSLTYKIYLTDPSGNTKTYSTTSSNKTVSGLSEYTTYEYYVEAIDPSGLSKTSVINNVTTYCPGTGCNGTIEYSKCSECGHYAHGEFCDGVVNVWCDCDGGSVGTLCPDCNGDLVIEDYYDSCEYCMDDGIRTDGSPCGWCGGDGMLDEDCRNCIEGYVYDTCPTCGGNRYYYIDCTCTEITYSSGYYCSTCNNSFTRTGSHCEHGSMKQHD